MLHVSASPLHGLPPYPPLLPFLLGSLSLVLLKVLPCFLTPLFRLWVLFWDNLDRNSPPLHDLNAVKPLSFSQLSKKLTFSIKSSTQQHILSIIHQYILLSLHVGPEICFHFFHKLEFLWQVEHKCLQHLLEDKWMCVIGYTSYDE